MVELAHGDIVTRVYTEAGLTGEELLTIYSTMVMTRCFDERVWLLNRQEKIAIATSCQGHEAAQMGSTWALRRGMTSSSCTTATWPSPSPWESRPRR
jgi:2-oxoisovalerate dehydrogenase E1 component alpha subunit